MVPAVSIPFRDLVSCSGLVPFPDGSRIGPCMEGCFSGAATYRADIDRIKAISMLSPDVLFYLGLFASIVPGRILEIGPYVGGSTVALASGHGAGRLPIISIEVGGSYETHPHLPSADILGDLRRNLQEF